MNNLRIAAFLDALRRSELVRSADMRAIEEWFLHPEVDVQVSAKRIVSQGWLTSMQVRMFWHGRGDELYLHQYILMDKIGEGGMGEVYRAWHRAMDRVVALKLIRPERLDNPEAIRRFRREIRAAASLSHENIVMAFDADESDGRNFFVMEYVDGRNLWDVVRESGRLSIRRASDLIRQAALGLQHAHERGMVHRDIKPSNLLVNGIRALKILDMGLARLTATADANEAVNPLTKDGAVVGTPDFIAPEQARNAATADIRADIYSLGATLYYLLTASPPFPEGSVTEKLLRHTVDPVPDPSILRSDIPPALRAIVMKMMAKSPGDRYEIPMQVAEKLIPFCVDPAAAASGVLRRLSPRPLVEELGADFSNPFGVGPAIPAVAVASALPVRHSLSFDTNLPPTVEEWVKPPNAIGRFVALAAGGAVLLLLLGLCLYLFAFDGRKKVDASMPPTLKFRSDIRMVLIPAGRFSMGSPETEARRYESEGPLHEVEIGYPFYMGRTEVTQGQYAAIFGQTPFEFRNQKDSKDLAAENVSWRDAVAFCDKLNSETETTRPKGMVWRLPSEAEWEYACRAGTKSRYSCGDVLSPEPFVYAESGARSPAKARTTSENAFKLSEMHGNVWEWCADCYAADWYANSPTKNPTGPKNGKQRVLRGGAWNTSDTECRSAHRRGEAMDFADGSIGFRLVLGPELADK